jgi:diguanylate cyclase (GGDEF)-like protein/PAS domain S-box-containing protein
MPSQMARRNRQLWATLYAIASQSHIFMTEQPQHRPSPGKSLHNAYIQLLKEESLWQGDVDASLRTVLNHCAEHLQVQRVGLWRFSGADRLYCQLLRDGQHGVREPALEIFAHDHGLYFAAMLNGRVLAIPDALTAPETATFRTAYFEPLGITSLLDATLRQAGKTIGVLCIEHVGAPRIWSTMEQNYAISIADLLTQLLAVHALYRTEERYRKVFNSTTDAIFVLQNNRMVECNNASLKLYDCTFEEFARHPPKRFWAEYQPDGSLSVAKARQYVQPTLDGIPQQFEWRQRRFDGSEFDSEVSLTRIELDQIPYIVACVRDITERKQAEARIQQLLALQQAIFDGANYSIIATGLDGVILSFNYGAERLLGYPQDEVINQLTPAHFHDEEELYWRSIELSEELDQTVAPGLAALTTNPTLNRTEEREWTYIRKDGERLPVLVCVSALRQGGQLSGFLYIASDMTERKKANEQLLNSKREMEFRANHDELTGLPNRSRLHDMTHAAIVTAQNRSQKLALMLIDLDRFKEVNDTLGHAIGDKLLQKIARQLDQILRARRAQLYRLGGDEFAVLMPNALDEPDILSLANAIHTSLRSPTEVEGISLELGGSVGISIYPRHGDNSHSLLRCADVAMYRAKSEASRTVIYNTDQDAHSPRRLSMMSELGTAIRQNQLVLHYQPRVHIASKRCMGCEALVRWQHPRLGMVPPAEFIPLAEMGDLIQPLGLWVLENALQQIVRWRERGLELLVSVNLSTRNLMDSAFPSHIEKLLKKYPVPPSLLEVEITESTLIGDPERALSVIGRIHNLGVRFAIDDFGTGYSSLGYLKRLPIDTLKIDRSFVRDMLTDEQDAVIVRSTLGLAHSFGLEVVAEGVEDVQTLEALKNLNCEQAQGYVISRPVPANEFEAWYRAEGNPPADS